MVDSVTITKPEDQSTEEHDAAMIAKAEGDTQTPDNQDASKETQDDARPEWLPEKFKSAEDMAKSYAELEKKLSQGNTDETQTPDTTTTDADAQEAAEKAGLDFDALQSEYDTNGQLSEETYESIVASGIPREMVDSYIAGRESLVTNMRTEMFNSVGGEETYTSMMEWAGANMTSEDIESYNEVMGSGNQAQIKLAVAGLNASYKADTGSNPSLLSGDTTANAGTKYDSVAQITAAMRDPKYKSDPAFRKEVEAKLARSSVI